MIKQFLFLSLLLFGLQTNQAQESCNCPSILKSISTEVETNSASYADQVAQKRVKEYTKHKKNIQKIAESLTTEKECVGLIKLYFSFLKDTHQNIYVTNDYYPFKSFNDTLKVKAFVKANVENFKVNDNVQSKGILGDWIHKNGSLGLQIQENTSKGRTYIGILKTPYKYLGHIGDLKIEFYKDKNNQLLANYWNFGQQPSIHKVSIKNDVLHIGRHTKFYRNSDNIVNQNNESIKNDTYFESLSDKTNYLRIHSFDYDNKNIIDSILVANTSKIINKPNLVIDLRHNGGGSDLSYQKLLPFVMDSIYYKSPTNASVWVSQDNFDYYDDEKYKYGVKTKEDSINADSKIKTLKSHLGSFTPQTFWVSKIDSVFKSPENVYLLVDSECASSTEGFILTAMQSSKVKTIGENTAGTLSYGDWRELQIDGLPATYAITTKKMHLLNDLNIESIGITPNIELNSNEKSSWLELTLKRIEG